MTNGTVRAKIMIRGAVQGVGFRPFIFRLAKELKINGSVQNSSTGLFIEAESDRNTIDLFLSRIPLDKPQHSFIYSTETTFLDPIGYSGFTIQESDSTGEPTTLILPDIAVCDECLKEMFDPANRRYRYPFINCTHCGPRYSIIQSLPYDRPNTTMKNFPMCPECEREYHDPLNRRFHAQPIACPHCGPHIELWEHTGKFLSSCDAALKETARILHSGKIIALKGLGGFQLLCDATNEAAVSELRRRKHRDEKPFALMFPTLEMIEQCCDVSEIEKRLLLSPESPIVLLVKKSKDHCKESRRDDEAISTAKKIGMFRPDKIGARNDNHFIARSVAPANPYLGVMLPYTPLHHLLMRELDIPIVATSGNIADEPMCIDEYEALHKLGGIADLFLVHNRPIQRYVDDSVVRVVLNREMVIRRARGYAPLPLIINDSSDESVLAVGGHLKNTIAVQKNNLLFVSQHIGDLETVQALECFKNAIGDISSLYEVHPSVIIHDNHPNYLSTTIARQMSGQKESFQHHFAHIASCMLENELNEPLLGAAWDGTGYGLDGTIWGGEFIEFDGSEFSRVATIRSFPLPGGDAASRESLRSAVGVLYEMFGEEALCQAPLTKKFSGSEKQLLLQMLEKEINTPRTSSMGRLFDAVGAMLGIRDRSNFEGQTAMEVEFLARQSSTDAYYPFELSASDIVKWMIDWEPMIKSLLNEFGNIDTAVIAKKFHNTLAEMIVSVALQLSFKKIVLSGGCFQNVLLLERTVKRLREVGFEAYWHQRIPTNDGGISVGQIYMHQLKRVSGFKYQVSSNIKEEAIPET